MREAAVDPLLVLVLLAELLRARHQPAAGRASGRPPLQGVLLGASCLARSPRPSCAARPGRRGRGRRRQGRRHPRDALRAPCARWPSGARSSRSSATSPRSLLGRRGDRRSRCSSRARCRSRRRTRDSLLVPTSLSTVLTGFLLLTTRRKAITQVVGYLILENGIFVMGLALHRGDARSSSRSGVLLDLVVGDLRDGHRHQPHQPRVRVARHARASRSSRSDRCCSSRSSSCRSPARCSRSSRRPRGGCALVAVARRAAPCAHRRGAASRRTCDGPRRLVRSSTRSGASCSAFARSSSSLCVDLRRRATSRLRPERPNRVFCACLLAFLGLDDARRPRSQHLGLIWVAIEATTLSTRPAHLLRPTTRARSRRPGSTC